MIKTSKVNLLEGDLLRAIIRLGYPMALNSLVETVYNLADAFWLGRMGPSAVAAPIISFFIIFLIMSIGLGFSVAGTSLVSQYIGDKQEEKANQVAGNLLYYLLLFSVFFVVFGLMFGRTFLELLQTPKDTFANTLSYYRIMIWGMPLVFPWFVYQSTMNGYGDTMSPLKISLFTAALNVVLDPIFIFGWMGFPAMGVAGAALATVLTRGVGSAIGLYLFFTGKKGLRLKLRHLKPEGSLRALLFKIGMPAAVGFSGSALGFIVLMGIVNKFGTQVVSVYGVGMRIIHIFMLPSLGVSSAVSAIVGQNLGAGYIDRAKQSVKKGLYLILGIVTPFVVLTAMFGGVLISIFIPGDPVIRELGKVMFIISGPSVIFFGCSSVIEGAFQGSGHTIPVMISNIMRIWMFRVPFVYLISYVLMNGPADIYASAGIWWGMVISNVSSFIFIFFWFSRGTWAKARIKRVGEVAMEYEPK